MADAPPSPGARWLEADTLRAAGVRHGFSTRGGGVSEGTRASLDLGIGARVAENLARLESAAGVGPILSVKQVHGRRVFSVGPAQTRAQLGAEEADALVAHTPGLVVGVRTADCVPLLGVARGVRGEVRVVAIHAGWRGTIEGVAAEGLKALLGDPAGPDAWASARLVIGPSIRRCCYEVDTLLAEAFWRALGEEVVTCVGAGRPHLDLVEANLRMMEGAGLPRDRVEVLDACTACDARRFYSHRRDGPNTGRHLSFVEVPHPSPVVSLT